MLSHHLSLPLFLCFFLSLSLSFFIFLSVCMFVLCCTLSVYFPMFSICFIICSLNSPLSVAFISHLFFPFSFSPFSLSLTLSLSLSLSPSFLFLSFSSRVNDKEEWRSWERRWQRQTLSKSFGHILKYSRLRERRKNPKQAIVPNLTLTQPNPT